MANKISVESGNPYRDSKGRLATSPDKALAASFAALQGKTYVPKEGSNKSGSANSELIRMMRQDAESQLEALRAEAKSKDEAPATDWKATGNTQEVEDFVKDSKFKDTIFHGTNASSATAVEEDGFNTDKDANGKYLGNGVYFTANEKLAGEYAQYTGSKNNEEGAVVGVKVNVQNPYIDNLDGGEELGGIAQPKYVHDIYEEGVAAGKWDSVEAFYEQTGDYHRYTEETKEYFTRKLKEHDGIILYENGVAVEVVIPDPKNIMVVKK